MDKKCAVCERTESTTEIIEHHITYSPERKILLCARCHLACGHPDKLQMIVNAMKKQGIQKHYMYQWLEEAPMLQQVAKEKGIIQTEF